MNEKPNHLNFSTEPLPQGFTVLKAADLTASTSIGITSNVAATISLTDKRQYRCPVHGITTNSGISGLGGLYFGDAMMRTPNISVTAGPKEKQGNYCLLCYVDWIHATFPKLEEVK